MLTVFRTLPEFLSPAPVLFTRDNCAVRLGVHVPTPGIDHHAMAALNNGGTLFGFLTCFPVAP
jgi:hypothetical protein